MASDRNRATRVAEAVKIELADLIAREVKDPRVREGLVTISNVVVNRDLAVAEVGVSILAGEPKAVLIGLQAAAKFLRGPLARRLQLRMAPELRFHHDQSQALASRLREIVLDDDARRLEAHPELAAADPPDDEPAADPADAEIPADEIPQELPLYLPPKPGGE